MFFYEGYSCPVCGKPFAETDDIVACPQCGAPHHRDCWKQEGHCHFAADHGTERQWTRPEPQPAADPAAPTAPQGAPETAPATHACPRCGSVNPEFAEFCAHCGQPLETSDWSSAPGGSRVPPYANTAGQPYSSPAGQPPYSGSYGEYAPFHMPVMDPYGGIPATETIEDVPVEELASTVGQNSAYYIPKFFSMSRGGSKQIWNWPAFLLTPYWLLFRKNYLSGGLVLLFFACKQVVMDVLAYTYVAPLLEASSGVTMFDAIQSAMLRGELTSYMWITMLLLVADLLLRVVFGLIGNRLYMRTCIHRAKKLRAKNSYTYRTDLMTAGGTSFMLGAVAYAILQFISMLVYAFFVV